MPPLGLFGRPIERAHRSDAQRRMARRCRPRLSAAVSRSSAARWSANLAFNGTWRHRRSYREARRCSSSTSGAGLTPQFPFRPVVTPWSRFGRHVPVARSASVVIVMYVDEAGGDRSSRDVGISHAPSTLPTTPPAAIRRRRSPHRPPARRRCRRPPQTPRRIQSVMLTLTRLDQRSRRLLATTP